MMRWATALVLALINHPALACSLPEGPSRAVVAVIDGDTLLLDDRTKLRLVGALKPTAPTDNLKDEDWPPAVATRTALERYAIGASLVLKEDGRALDRYAQRMAQAYVVAPEGTWWLQGRLVEEGLARAYSYEDNRGCAAELIALEAKARRNRKGLWAGAAYAPRPASSPRDLMRYAGSYQLVEGTVTAAVTRKGKTYLDFGPDWRSDFTAVLDADARKEFEAAGLAPETLGGQRIRVRGWIESTAGPQIRVTHTEQIEIISADGSSAVIGGKTP